MSTKYNKLMYIYDCRLRMGDDSFLFLLKETENMINQFCTLRQ